MPSLQQEMRLEIFKDGPRSPGARPDSGHQRRSRVLGSGAGLTETTE
jgi:hypothetical protein